MVLSYEEIKSLTTGVSTVIESFDGIRFHRFTAEQEAYYEITSPNAERNFYDRCLATAGVRMMFKTDSKTLKLKGSVIKRTSRNYYSFDIFVNGKEIGNIDNFSNVELSDDYTEQEFPLSDFSREFSLIEGIKEVCIYFPWSVEVVLNELSIDDGAFVQPVKREKKLLAFGDSITQGYDALRPSNRYVSRLSDMLYVEETNKGIGGEFFVPELARCSDNFEPDYITVAYGTNDWSKKSEDDFILRCKSFFENLKSNYPHSKIFAITPVWRADYQGKRKFGNFENVEKGIRNVTSDFENVFLIPGFNLINHERIFFADSRLHPNDEGFIRYSDNLYSQLVKHL